MSPIRQHLVLPWICLLALLHTPAQGADILARWIHPGIGDWNDPANWKDGLVPVSTQEDQYHVVITNTAVPWQYIQSSLSQPMSVSTLTLGNVLYAYGGDGGLPQQFEVRNQFRWLGGSLSGWACTYHLRGEALFEGETHKILDRTCTLRIHGHALWTGGHLAWGGYGHASIEAGALFELNTGGTIGSVGTTDSVSISNRGTLRMTAPGKVVRVHSDFENAGAIEVQSGELQFAGGYSGTGSIHVATNASLSMTVGQWNPFIRTGTGKILLTGSHEILSDMQFPGRVWLNANVHGNGSLTLTDGLWEGGQFEGPGSLVIAAGGKLSVQKTGVRLARTLSNSGEVSLAPGVVVTLQDGMTHENHSNGLVTLAAASSFGTGSSPSLRFVNRGIIRNAQAGFGSADFQCTLLNHGLVRSTQGRVGVLGGGTNLGTFEALAPGSIRTFNVHFPATSILQGDGLLQMAGGSVDGEISTNLAISTSGLVVHRPEPYDLRGFQIAGSIYFTGTGGVRAREYLLLHGGYRYGRVKSLGSAEINVSNAEIRDGAVLDLDGTSAFAGGTVQLMDATFTNRGAMNVLGSAEMSIESGSLAVNEGTWTFNRQIGSMNVSVTPQSTRWRTADLSGETTVENGPFQISGPVTLLPGRLSAGPEALMVFSDLGVTNAEVRLVRSTLSLTRRITSAGGSFVLEDARLIFPEALFSGTALLGTVMFSGHGVLQTDLAVHRLGLMATAGTNHLRIEGNLTFPTNATFLTIVPIHTNGASRFPFVEVRGTVALGGALQLSPGFPLDSPSFVAGPVTLIESDEPVTGSFTNVANGGVLSGPNGFRCRIHYGPDSPYGPNRVVMTGFGSTFDLWRTTRFSPGELVDPAISGPDADSDGNGFNNIAEFVFALEPGNGIRLTAPNADGTSTVQIRRRKDIGNLTARLGLSPDLQSWTDTGVGNSGGGLILHRAYDLPEAYEYHYLVPGAPPSLYLRLLVEGTW